MVLPQDPVMLLSVINTALRDQYPSLEELCRAEDIDADMLCAKLDTISYTYDRTQNRFI